MQGCMMSSSYMHCRRQYIEARGVDQSARSAEKFFHLHFSVVWVVWVGSHSTFALCTALLSGRLTITQMY